MAIVHGLFVYITMENQHCQWENKLFQWPCSKANCERLPEGNMTPLNPIKPAFSYGFPMVFLWFSFTRGCWSMGWSIQSHTRLTLEALEVAWWTPGFPVAMVLSGINALFGLGQGGPGPGVFQKKTWENEHVDWTSVKIIWNWFWCGSNKSLVKENVVVRLK